MPVVLHVSLQCSFAVGLIAIFVVVVYSASTTQVLQLIAMPTLAEAVVESFLTMLDAQGLSPLSSAAQIMELVSIAASTVKMLESDAQVVCDYMTSLFTFCSAILIYLLIDSSSIKLL